MFADLVMRKRKSLSTVWVSVNLSRIAIWDKLRYGAAQPLYVASTPADQEIGSNKPTDVVKYWCLTMLKLF